MMDLKVMGSALAQLEEERGIPKEKIIEAIEQALSAAYKKDYGKKGQIVRADFDLNTGTTEFSQVKIVVDPSEVRMETEEEDDEPSVTDTNKATQEEHTENEEEEGNELVKFNPEHHILLEDAKKIKADAQPGNELIFPLEARDDYGRIAAQTAKQVIIQRIREAEKVSVLDEYETQEGEIVAGTVQRVERGTIFVDLGKTTGIIPYDEQIPGERYRQGERIRAYLYSVEETPKGINLRLSRSHPHFIKKLFELEVPEMSAGTVELKAIAREAGSRTKIAVYSEDEHIDPVGSCVGQRGVRVSTVMSELGGEKIDIIEWSDDAEKFIEDALSPAHILEVEIEEEEKKATVKVAEDQLSLAIGKGGQNVRLAAKLTNWKIDIQGTEGETVAETDGEYVEVETPVTSDVPQELSKESEDGVSSDEAETEERKETGDFPPEPQDDVQETTPESTEEAVAEEEVKDDEEEKS